MPTSHYETINTVMNLFLYLLINALSIILNNGCGGSVHMPKQSSVSVHLSGQQSITAGDWAKVEFDTELWDTQSEFDPTTNYRFTADVDGIYLVICQITINVDSVNDDLIVEVRVNDVDAITTERCAATTASEAMVATRILSLNASDYIEVWVQNFDNNDSVFAAADSTFLTIHKIARRS